MQKVYLLLRNNLQTGPYSLDDIVQLPLKSSDLVWVEGKSCGWSFPHEVAALKPYVPQPEEAVLTPTNYEPISAQHKNYLPPEAVMPQPAATPAKHIYVSLPANTLPQQQTEPVTTEQTFAQKAEAIRQRAQTYAAPAEGVADDALHTGYKRSLADVEESYTSWMVQQKKKKKTVKPGVVASGVLLLLLLAGGFVLLRKPAARNTPPVAVAGQNVMSTSAAVVTTEPATQVEEEKRTEKNALIKKIKSSNTIVATHKTAIAKNTQNKELHQPAEDKTVPVVTEENNHAAPAENKESPTTTTEQPKKKLADKIDGFFNKFKIKKTENKPVKEPQTTNTGGRQATHRNERTEVPEATEDVKSMVTLTSNEADENLMLGVRGLKITLRNRSNSTIKKATVAVNYYNEDNELLDKKTVTFANIPAGKQLTVAAPDHRLADHTTYALITAE